MAADPGEALELGPATIVPIRGVHGISVETSYSDGTDTPPGLPRFLGYVIDLAGVRVYHAGDTIFFDGLVEQLADLAIDIALLPINGRDHAREKAGLVGNMGPREASDLAAAIGAGVVVPLHWDLMAGNTENPAHLVDYLSRTHPDITALVLGRFAGVTLGKPI
jgi:L-ascorbate metabolism protein UlaG (beta-lactamase superfamily)